MSALLRRLLSPTRAPPLVRWAELASTLDGRSTPLPAAEALAGVRVHFCGGGEHAEVSYRPPRPPPALGPKSLGFGDQLPPASPRDATRIVLDLEVLAPRLAVERRPSQLAKPPLADGDESGCLGRAKEPWAGRRATGDDTGHGGGDERSPPVRPATSRPQADAGRATPRTAVAGLAGAAEGPLRGVTTSETSGWRWPSGSASWKLLSDTGFQRPLRISGELLRGPTAVVSTSTQG